MSTQEEENLSTPEQENLPQDDSPDEDDIDVITSKASTLSFGTASEFVLDLLSANTCMFLSPQQDSLVGLTILLILIASLTVSHQKESSRNTRLMDRLGKQFTLPDGITRSFRAIPDVLGANNWQSGDTPPVDLVPIAVVLRHSRTPAPFTVVDVNTSLAHLQNVGLSYGHFTLGIDIRRIRVFTYIQIASAQLPIEQWAEQPQNINIPPVHRGALYFDVRHLFHHTFWLSSSAVGVNLRRYFFVPAPLRLRGGGEGGHEKAGKEKEGNSNDGTSGEEHYNFVFPEEAQIHVVMLLRGTSALLPIVPCMCSYPLPDR